jgi:hypothetical protein
MGSTMSKKSGGSAVCWETLDESIAEVILVGVLVQQLKGFYPMRAFLRVVTFNHRVHDHAWTHLAILLKQSVDDETTFELGKNASIYLEEYRPRHGDRITEMSGGPMALSTESIRNFVDSERHYRYSFVAKNCKHFVYEFMMQVVRVPFDRFHRLCNRIEHGHPIEKH